MPPIEFPPEQVLLLQGIQTYATVKDLKDCLKLIGCKPEIPPKLVKDRKNKNFKACFLNFGSREEAKVAYQNISRKIGSFPLIFDASKGICSQKSGGGTIVDEDDVPLVDHIVTLIKKSPDGFVQAAQIGASVRKNESWDDEVEAKGGLKYFCSDNDDKLQFVVDGGCGKIKLAQVKRATLPVGTKVSIKVDRPSKGWGSAFAWSVGTVRSIDRGIVLVDFPEAHNWKGDESDLEQVSGVNRVTKDIGSRDSAFDEFGFVRNLSDGKFEFTGNAMEDRDAQHREFGFVHSGQKLTRQQPYFEVSIVFNCPQSIGIGLSGNNFHAGSMVGSVSESIGLHSNDGKLFYEGNPILFGPTSSAGDTIGCGIFFDESDKPETIFFTRNKTLVGRFPLGSVDRGMLFPVVSSASPAVVKVDLKVSPPTIPIACVLRTFALEAKFNDESNKFKPVKRQGPPNHKGEIPVVFKGYKETVWIPNTNQRIKKIEDCPVSIEFSNFELAFEMINDGDMIEVIDESIHMMRECIHIRNNLTVVAAAGGKPTISGYDVHVFNIHASTVIKGLFVRSVGGDKLRKVSEGGGAGVVLFRGDLSIEDCVISSENGTAIGVSESKGVAVARNLTVKNSKCGPCGRHGVVVYPCTNEILLQSVDISAKMYGVANNDATLRIIDCGLKHASSGLICVRTDQKTPSPHTTIFRSVINCKLQALIVKSSAGEYELTSKECTIENCERAIEATGKGVIVFFDNSNSVKLSSKPNLAENCAKIEVISSPSLLAGPAHVTEAPHIAVVASPAKSTSGTSAVNIAAISSDASPLKQDVKNDASVSSEATNFHRFCRLLQDVGTEILVKIFKVFYEKKEKKPWKASCGSNLLSRMASGKFYTQQYKIISQGNCEEWDITLLSSLLIHAPGYLNTAGFGKAVKGVETIRKARNDISHKNVLTEETRVLSADVFKSKWTEVSSAAEELLHYLSETDKAHYHSKIQEISKEACHADMLQKILERFDVEDRMIQEGLRRANEKAEEAMKMAQEMKEKLPAQMKVEVNAIVQEIFKRGQVEIL